MITSFPPFVKNLKVHPLTLLFKRFWTKLTWICDLYIIENIFKFVRVDLVKRFTYLDHPDVSQWGIRARVKFDF